MIDDRLIHLQQKWGWTTLNVNQTENLYFFLSLVYFFSVLLSSTFWSKGCKVSRISITTYKNLITLENYL